MWSSNASPISPRLLGRSRAAVRAAIDRYAAVLDKHCRSDPYNWFNFFDFWQARMRHPRMSGEPLGLLLAVLCAAGSLARHRAPLRRRSLGDLDEVMRLLAMRQHGQVEFVEQHFLAILKHPIESSGEMRYDAPDHLEKRTLLPRPETLVLDGGD